MKEALEELSLKELIGYSIESEKNCNAVYMDIAKGLPELMANRFQSLAEDEEIHQEQLLKLHEKLYGDRDYVVPENKGMPPIECNVQTESVGNLLDALGKAVKEEGKSYDIYKFASKHHKKQRIYFDYLAVMEYDHIESLKKEIELIEGKIIDRSRVMKRTPDSFFSFEFEKRQSE